MIHADSGENALGYSSLYIERQVLVYQSRPSPLPRGLFFLHCDKFVFQSFKIKIVNHRPLTKVSQLLLQMIKVFKVKVFTYYSALISLPTCILFKGALQ